MVWDKPAPLDWGFAQYNIPNAGQNIRDFLKPKFATYQLPDDVIFSTAPLPKTSTGKFLKTALREQYADHVLPEM